MKKVSIFWFRRDLRVEDNHGLFQALSSDVPVLPLFIFDTNILDRLPSKKDGRVEFIHQALEAINTQIGGHLCLKQGDPLTIFRSLFSEWEVVKVYTNHDYERYGIDRDGDRKDFRCEADVEEWGYKFHMNDVCATVGIENLKHFKDIVGKHRDNASFYDKNLIDTPGVTLLKREEGHDSAFWIYSMIVENRDGFYKWMDECGISVSQVHERNDKHTCVREYRTALPSLDKTIGKVISIPVGWWLSEEDREYIVDCIKKGW